MPPVTLVDIFRDLMVEEGDKLMLARIAEHPINGRSVMLRWQSGNVMIQQEGRNVLSALYRLHKAVMVDLELRMKGGATK